MLTDEASVGLKKKVLLLTKLRGVICENRKFCCDEGLFGEY